MLQNCLTYQLYEGCCYVKLWWVTSIQYVTWDRWTRHHLYEGCCYVKQSSWACLEVFLAVLHHCRSLYSHLHASHILLHRQ